MLLTVAPTPHLKRVGWVVTSLSLIVIGFATLLPSDHPAGSWPLCIICGSLGGVDAVLNVLLFVPLGLGLSLMGSGGRRAILTALGISILIEMAQLAAIPGRDASIGDVLTNTLGGSIGFAIGARAHVFLRPSRSQAIKLTVAWAALWVAIQVFSSYALLPSLPDSRYYGQIAHSFPNLATFRGVVRSARIGSLTVPDSRFADSTIVKSSLLAHDAVSATVIPAQPTNAVAPIVRVVDAEHEEIVLLGQRGLGMVFGVRTNASRLRFRRAFFLLRGAFPDCKSHDTCTAPTSLTISARYGQTVVELDARGQSLKRSRNISLSPSLGWTFFLPTQWYIDGSASESALTALWIFVLLIPLGYWGFHTPSVRPAHSSLSESAPILFSISAILIVGFWLVPLFFGLPAATPFEWLSALAGVAIGPAIHSWRFKTAT